MTEPTEDTWPRAQDLLRTCIREHACSRLTNGHLPTRLLDIRGYVGGCMKLVVTAEQEKASIGKYTALSYCWGTSNNFKLTAETISNRKEGFNITELPETLREAICITNDLDIGYIWIDSLCIIQDSSTDWERESMQMADVYGNAFVTIVAANSRDCAQGFIGLSTDSQVSGPMNRSRWTAPREVIAFKDEPLSLRAWAYQEWELSSRRLVFCFKRVFFSCSGFRLQGALWRYQNRLTSRASMSDWQVMVERYCSRSLTIPEDKLVAIAGVAQEFSRLTDGSCGNYVCGLWEKKLVDQLLWRCGDGIGFWNTTGVKGRPRRWRAPTWTWASVDGAIEFDPMKKTAMPETKVLSVCVNLLSAESPFGMVDSGFLVICGLCAEFLTPDILDLSATMIGETGVETHLQWDGKKHGFVSLDWELEGEWRKWDSQVLHFLALSVLASSTEITPGKPSGAFSGLILRKKSQDSFERIGYFQLWAGYNDERFAQNAIKGVYTIV